MTRCAANRAEMESVSVASAARLPETNAGEMYMKWRRPWINMPQRVWGWIFVVRCNFKRTGLATSAANDRMRRYMFEYLLGSLGFLPLVYEPFSPVIEWKWSTDYEAVLNGKTRIWQKSSDWYRAFINFIIFFKWLYLFHPLKHDRKNILMIKINFI